MYSSTIAIRFRICVLSFLVLVCLVDAECALAFSSDLIDLAGPKAAATPEAINRNEAGTNEDLLDEVKQLAADGRYADAIAGLTDAIGRDPEDAVLYFKRGSLYYYLMLSANFKAANAEISPPTKAVVPCNETAEPLCNACPSMSTDCCTRALADFNRAIFLKTHYDVFYYMRGVLFSSDCCPQQNLWNALADYERALAINAKNAVYHLERGLVWAKLGHYREAVSNINRAILLAPANYYYHYEKGLIQEKIGLFSEAANSFKAALELAPQDRLSAFSLDLSRARKDNCIELIADYTEIIKKRPAFATFYINRAICYGELKKYTQGIADITTALGLQNDRRDLYFMRGKLYDQGGLKTNAWKDFEKACHLGQSTACHYLKSGETKEARGDRWVSFWSSRGHRKYFYDDARVMKKDGTRKLVRVRIASNVGVDSTRSTGSSNLSDLKKQGDTFETWEFDCLRSRFRILKRQITDNEGKIVTGRQLSGKGFRPVFSEGISGKLFGIVCDPQDMKRRLTLSEDRR